MVLEKENLLVLPKERTRQAPNELEDLWFKKFPPHLDFKGRDFEFDYNCERALVALGVGELDCPVNATWAAFTFAGSAVAALSGKYIVPFEKDPWWEKDFVYHIWEALWPAAVENSDKLEKSFLAFLLRDFLPVHYSSPPFSSWTASNFEEHWRIFEYTDTVRNRIGNLRLKTIRSGKEAFAELPKPIQSSIRLVANYVPDMLSITTQQAYR